MNNEQLFYLQKERQHNRNASFSRRSAHGGQLRLTEAANGDTVALTQLSVALQADQIVDGYPTGGDQLGGRAARHGKRRAHQKSSRREGTVSRSAFRSAGGRCTSSKAIADRCSFVRPALVRFSSR